MPSFQLFGFQEGSPVALSVAQGQVSVTASVAQWSRPTAPPVALQRGPETGYRIEAVADDLLGSLGFTVTQNGTALGPFTRTAAQQVSGAAVNHTPPQASATATPGQYTATTGLWTHGLAVAPTPTVQWRRDGTAIAGATTVTYPTQPGDAGRTLSCAVTVAGVTAVSNGIAVPAARNALIPGTGADPFALAHVWQNADATGPVTLASNGAALRGFTDPTGGPPLQPFAGSVAALSVSGSNYHVQFQDDITITSTVRTPALTGNWAIFARVRPNSLTGERPIFAPQGPNGDLVLRCDNGVLTIAAKTGGTTTFRTGPTLVVDTTYSIVVERTKGTALTFHVTGFSPVVAADLPDANSTPFPPGVSDSGTFLSSRWLGGIANVGLMRGLPTSTLRTKFLTGPLALADLTGFDHFWPM